jgi:hypothetical protein
MTSVMSVRLDAVLAQRADQPSVATRGHLGAVVAQRAEQPSVVTRDVLPDVRPEAGVDHDQAIARSADEEAADGEFEQTLRREEIAVARRLPVREGLAVAEERGVHVDRSVRNRRHIQGSYAHALSFELISAIVPAMWSLGRVLTLEPGSCA